MAPANTNAPFGLILLQSTASSCTLGIAEGGKFMRKIILVVASAVALGAATMTTGALGADQPGFVGRPGLNHHFAYHHGHFAEYFGPLPGTYAWWYDHEHYNDDCWDGRRWVLTRFGWSWEACVWP
jgi:hypothetical protein